MAKARLTVTIDQELDERLTAYSEATLVAKSKLVNQALIEYLEKHQNN